ncbi:lipopolysaccharide biosynthesis protein [Brachybacterium sp. YJGR34]|uniref:lipopolysaccharide biosynthesis protein n=1 Tax=Brachybacterium sp. YJGR34 TaxID=2059911 RepID=UPI001300AD09|nr:lipopolysaccharide biosynthesis protein [Brachybacterium sp. YJGR34]
MTEPEAPQEELAPDGLGARGGRGALLGVAGKLAKLAVNLLSLIVFARLLTPADFGLVAMITAVVGAAELVRDLGLSTAAVRAPSLSRAQRDNLWWVNTALGAGAAAVVCALAPLLAWFYGDPRLVALTLVYSTVFLLSGMATQYSADLMRSMRFGRLALAQIVAALAAFGVALLAALGGWGYWALALQQVLGGALTLILLAAVAGWLPRRFRRGVPLREFFRFGLPLFGSQLLTYASGNLDQVLVGRFFGAADLGHYSRGIQLVRMPMNQVRGPLSNAALSTLAKVREDRESYARLLAKAQLGMLYPLAILSTAVAVVAPDLVPFLLGPEWTAVAAFVTIFALGDMISSLAAAGGWLYLSEGKSAALLRYTALSAAVRIVMFLVAVPLGIHAVAAVYVLAPLLLWPFSLWYCQRATGRPTLPLLRGSLRVFVVTMLSFVAGYGVQLAMDAPGPGRLFASAGAYLVVLGLLALIPAIRRDLREVLGMVRTVLGRRPAASGAGTGQEA